MDTLEKDKISIIVPVYNAEMFLEKCMASILNQTYHNLEVVMVDDGAKDSSGMMCDEFAKKDNRVKVIHKQNGGLSSARNAGIEQATGKYVAFVDSDDYIESDMIEVLHKKMVETGSDVASISIAMVKVSGELINGTNTEECYCYEGDDILKELLLHKTLKNYSCDKMYKRDLLSGIKYIEGICYEDVPFMYSVMKKAKKVVYYDVIKYYYVKHKGAISATCSEKNVNDYLNGIINRYIEIEKDFPQLATYNDYAIANTGIHAYYKVMLSNIGVENYKDKLDFIKKKCVFILNNKEREVTDLFSTYQKACFYMLLNDEELFIYFLQNRQKKNLSNSAA